MNMGRPCPFCSCSIVLACSQGFHHCRGFVPLNLERYKERKNRLPCQGGARNCKINSSQHLIQRTVNDLDLCADLITFSLG